MNTDNSMYMVCSSHPILPQPLSKQGCPENSELGVRSCSSIPYLAVLTSSPLPPFSPAPPPSPFRSSDVRTALTPLTPCSWHILLRGGGCLLSDGCASSWYHSHVRGYYSDGVKGPLLIHPSPSRKRPSEKLGAEDYTAG